MIEVFFGGRKVSAGEQNRNKIKPESLCNRPVSCAHNFCELKPETVRTLVPADRGMIQDPKLHL
jgi:hypothetical protein